MVSVIRSVLLLALLLAGYPALAAFGIFQVNNNSAPASFTPAWQDLRVGAGGNMAGIVAYSDGTVVGRGDVYGGWIYKPSGPCTAGGGSLTGSCWQNTITATSLGSYTSQSAAGNGNFGAGSFAVCPSNTQVIYTSLDSPGGVGGKLFVTTNGGTSWVPVGQTTQLTTGIIANGSSASNLLEQIVCDPNNPDTVIVGAWNDKIYKVTNGRSGLSATVAALPAPVASTGAKGAAIAYELGSSSHILACVYGTGCYESVDGGTSYTSRVSGGPTNVDQVLSDKYGTFWVVTRQSLLRKYTTGGGWVSTSAFNPVSVATDPTSSSQGAQRVAVVSDFTGQLNVSDDNGSTWGALWAGGITPWTSPAGQPAWIATANQGGAGAQFLNVNQVSIDVNGVVWIAGGIAFYNSTQQAGDPPWVSLTSACGTCSGTTITFASVPATVRVGMRVQDSTGFTVPNNTTVIGKTATTVTLSASSSGVANGSRILFSANQYYAANTVDTFTMVVNEIHAGPNNAPVTCQWDRAYIRVGNPDDFSTSIQYPDVSILSNTFGSVGAIVGCWGMDWGAGTPNLLVGTSTQNGSAPAYSIDGGFTWNLWGTVPTGFNLGGKVAAWSSSNFVTVPGQNLATIYYTTNSGTNWNAASFTGGTPTTFNDNYFIIGRHPITADRVNANTFYAVDNTHQVWKSTDSGITFALQSTVDIGTNMVNTQLKAVPGNAGHLLYSGGSVATNIGGLFKSINGGSSWTNCNSNLKDVLAFGIGAAKPGGSGYPTIYATGYLSTVYGIYYSADGCATWTALNVPSTGNNRTYPMDLVSQVAWMEGDMSVYGRVNVAWLTGAGAGYIDMADACPWVGWTSSVKPNQALSGTVSLAAQRSGLVTPTSVNFYVDGVLIGTQTAGSGTPTTYSQSWNASGVTPGAHTLKVEAVGNGCTAGGGGNSFSIPITTI